MIYLDNAATSLQKPEEVEEEMIRALHTMGNPGRGALMPRCRQEDAFIRLESS